MNYLIDSDFLYALFLQNDAHHAKAKKIIELIENDNLYVFNLVLYETATVLSRKVGQREAIQFVNAYPSLGLFILSIDTSTEQAAWSIFTEQKRKNISFIDCANLSYATAHGSDAILSFDTFYPESLRYALPK